MIKKPTLPVEQIGVGCALGPESPSHLLTVIHQVRKGNAQFGDQFDHALRSILGIVGMDIGVDGHRVDARPNKLFGQTHQARPLSLSVGAMIADKDHQQPLASQQRAAAELLTGRIVERKGRHRAAEGQIDRLNQGHDRNSLI